MVVGHQHGAQAGPLRPPDVVVGTVAHEDRGGGVDHTHGVEGRPEHRGVGLEVCHLAGVEADLEGVDQAVTGQEALVEGPGPVRVGQQPQAQAPLGQGDQGGGGVGEVADVGGPGVEVAQRRFLQHRLGHVEAQLGRRLGHQVAQRGRTALPGRAGPEAGLHRAQALGHLRVPVGGQVGGGQGPHVGHLQGHELGQGAAPVEDHRLHRLVPTGHGGRR